MIRHTRQILLLSFLFCNFAMAGFENAEINLGRSIYEKGIGRDGRAIGATLHGGVALTGASVACAGCHGQDARGGGEAFIRAPDIRWLNLSKPYTARRAGVAGVPYDQKSFARAMRSGITAGGTRLDPVMPRFSLADDEVASLVAYLSIMDDLVIKKESRVVVLGLLPTPGQNSAADSLALKMQNCPTSRERNRVVAINILYFSDPEDAIAQLNEHIEKNPGSIILAPYLLGWEARYIDALSRRRIATVLPFSFLDPPEENNWHYRFPGLQTQIKALLKSAKHSGYSRLSIVQDPNDAFSLKLAAFSRKAALQYQFEIATDPEEPISETTGTAKLWLTSLTDNAAAGAIRTGELMLVPALFYGGAEKGDGLIHKLPGIQWRIAYPYAPQRENGIWRKPMDVWAGAACEFLSLMSEEAATSKTLPGIVLRWEPDLFLLPRPSDSEILQHVYIDELRPH